MKLPHFTAKNSLSSSLCSHAAATGSAFAHGTQPQGLAIVPLAGADRCEKKMTDHRCNVHGKCVGDTGHTCYALYERESGGQWTQYSCHYLPGTFEKCPF